jgi:hypothetical protein
VRKRQPPVQRLQHTSAYVSRRQHTSAYVSIRQHTSVYVTSAYVSIRYVSICQHMSAYVSIRQHTSACRRRHVKKEAACAAPAVAPSVPSVKQR